MDAPVVAIDIDVHCGLYIKNIHRSSSLILDVKAFRTAKYTCTLQLGQLLTIRDKT